MKKILVATVLVLLVAAAGAREGGPGVGDTAPDFTLRGSDGKDHSLGDYRGRPVVIAWFPKAFTGG